MQAQDSQSGGPTDGVAISATSPNSNWPGIKGGLDDQSTTAVASDVANNAGAIGAVQVKYAQDDGFYGSDSTKNVALVKNASGDYTAPTSVDVASALAYATQLPNGTQELDFNGVGPNVLQPLDVQLPADADDWMVAVQGRHHEPVRQLPTRC